MKNDGLITHVYHIYSIIFKDSTKEMYSTWSNNMMMETRMNDCANDIIKTTTKSIFINCKDTSIIGVAKPYQLVSEVMISHYSTKEVYSTWSNNMMMETRMNDCTNDIIKTKTRGIFINCKGTSIIGMARPYQLVRKVMINH